MDGVEAGNVSMGSEARWPMVVNLANSIIGVSVLAMPFCLRECGILLGTLLLLGSNVLTRITSHLLVKGAHIARRRSYEQYTATVLGPWGKAFIEVMMILFLFSTLCAFNVVVGDLGPSIVAHVLGIDHESPRLRAAVMTAICGFVIVPLSLLRRPESLAIISNLAILFYGAFVLRMLLLSVPFLLFPSTWLNEIEWWRPGGVLECLPILVLSLSCQTQLFVTAEAMSDPSPTAMDSVVSGAVNLCSSVYLAVGFLGYVCFHDRAELAGDVLVLFAPTPLTQLIKLGFTLSVAVSFPLMLFPCRRAIYTLLFDQRPKNPDLPQDHAIPDGPFQFLTFSIVLLSLMVGIMIPNVEFVLGLTGAMIGMPVCVIIPSLLFLQVAPEHQFYSRISAQVCFVVGALMMVVCTYATLHENSPGIEKPFLDIRTTTIGISNLSHIPKVAALTDPPGMVGVPLEKTAKAGPAIEDGPKRAEPPVPDEKVVVEGNAAAADVAVDKETAEGSKDPKIGPQGGTKAPAVAKATNNRASFILEENAAAILQELKQQRREQEALIKEQKAILKDLKKVKEEEEGKADPQLEEIRAPPPEEKKIDVPGHLPDTPDRKAPLNKNPPPPKENPPKLEAQPVDTKKAVPISDDIDRL